MMNIIILHHFDYPEGMATTKRFQLFADYFQSKGCRVTFVLKVHSVDSSGIIAGTHKGNPFYKVFFEKHKKYPFFYDRRQHKQIIKTITSLYKESSRNIIITGGISPEFHIVVRKLIPQWELYCDYVEDFTTVGSHYSGLWKVDFWWYLKSRIAVILYKPLVLAAQNFMFRNAKGISAISPFLYGKAKKNNSNVIEIPVTANKMPPIPKTNYGKPFKLFFAGTGSHKDGLDTIAKSFDKLSQKYEIQLQISGKVTQSGKNLVKTNCKYIEKVAFLGYLKDKDYFDKLQQADIMLMTRNNTKFANAGFPFKLGEYLATSNPVIATRVSGVEKYLTDKENAVLIEPEDVDALVKGITYLIENKDKAERIGKAGYRVFEEHFNAETNCEKFYNFILSTK